jgi:acyl carrier protein
LIELQNHRSGKLAILVELTCDFPKFIENKSIFRTGLNLATEGKAVNKKIGPLHCHQPAHLIRIQTSTLDPIPTVAYPGGLSRQFDADQGFGAPRIGQWPIRTNSAQGPGMNGVHLQDLINEQHRTPVREQILDGQIGTFKGAHISSAFLGWSSNAACGLPAAAIRGEPLVFPREYSPSLDDKCAKATILAFFSVLAFFFHQQTAFFPEEANCLPRLAYVDRTMNELIEELKVKLIALLNLTDVTPEHFDAQARLVGGELGIDSIDVLEMVVMVERDYGVVINSQEVGEKVFASLASLAAYIQANRPGGAG